MSNNILYCAFCIYISPPPFHEEHEAITIMNGNAVCETHMRYISHYDGNHDKALRFMNRYRKGDVDARTQL